MVKGFRDEYNPNRQVGRNRWAQDIDDFSGGEFPGQPPGPPQSEQPDRGVMTDPNTQDYAPVTGTAGQFYTPDRMMTVSAGYPDATGPPQSEQPRRGIFAPQFDSASPQPPGDVAGRAPIYTGPSQLAPNSEWASRTGGGNQSFSVPQPLAPVVTQPQQISNYGPVGDFMNRLRPQEYT